MINTIASLIVPIFGAPFILGFPDKITTKKKKKYLGKGKTLETHMSDAQRMAMTAGSAAAFLIAGILVAWMTRDIFITAVYAIMYTCCAMVMQIDANIRIIPNEILLVMLLDAAALKIAEAVKMQNGWNIINSVITMVIVFEVLDKVVNTISRLFGAQAIGMGDIKLMSLLTFFYWGNLDRMIGWLLGFCIAVFGVLIPMLLMKKISKFSFFAFGPYITAGVAGEAIYAFIKYMMQATALAGVPAM